MPPDGYPAFQYLQSVRVSHIEPWISAIPSGPFRVEVGEAGTMRHALGKGGDRVMEMQA